jgi:hypothetical protein
MKKMLFVMAVATLPAIAGGCNCCGLANCCPCNWFNRGAYCGTPTPTYLPYSPVAASPCAPVAASPYVPAVMPQYATPFASPLAATPAMNAPMMTSPAMGAPMIADPSMLGYMQQAQPMAYADPNCGYVEPGCGYPNMVGYGPAMPMSYGGCCEGGSAGSYSGGTVNGPSESFIEPTPTP